MIAKHELTGMILAGGEGRRMGGRDKGLEPFAGLPLVAHTVKRFEGQVHELSWVVLVEAVLRLAMRRRWPLESLRLQRHRGASRHVRHIAQPFKAV